MKSMKKPFNYGAVTEENLFIVHEGLVDIFLLFSLCFMIFFE